MAQTPPCLLLLQQLVAAVLVLKGRVRLLYLVVQVVAVATTLT
jgi:hypothetical protein